MFRFEPLSVSHSQHLGCLWVSAPVENSNTKATKRALVKPRAIQTQQKDVDEEERRAGNGSWKARELGRGKRWEAIGSEKNNAFFRSCLCKSWGSLSMYFHALPCAPQSTSSKVSCIWTLVQSMYEWLSAQQQTQAPWASLYNFSPRSSLFRIHCHSFCLCYYIIQSECMNWERPLYCFFFS